MVNKTPARPDVNRDAVPLTRLSASIPVGQCFRGNATHYIADDGARISLKATQQNISYLHREVLAAIKLVQLGTPVREDALDRVWIGAWYVQTDADMVFAVRPHKEIHELRGNTPANLRKAIAIAIRGHVADVMSAYQTNEVY